MIKQDYAILSADKAKNTYVIHCKPWLAKQVLHETETTVTYEPATRADGTPLGSQEIVDTDWEFINEEGLAQKPPTPPPSPDQSHEKLPKIPEAFLFQYSGWW